MALSVLDQRPDIHTLVVPARVYEIGVIHVAGIALLAKVPDEYTRNPSEIEAFITSCACKIRRTNIRR